VITSLINLDCLCSCRSLAQPSETLAMDASAYANAAKTTNVDCLSNVYGSELWNLDNGPSHIDIVWLDGKACAGFGVYTRLHI